MLITILQHYLLWHYTRAYAEMIHILKNLLWFLGHFFSIRPLTRTLFAPFKRITETRHKAWDFEDFAGRIIINLMSRLIGALLRGSVIICGLVSMLLTTLLGVTIFLLWFMAPVIIAAVITSGIVFLFL
jgi:hypothetical protein